MPSNGAPNFLLDPPERGEAEAKAIVEPFPSHSRKGAGLQPRLFRLKVGGATRPEDYALVSVDTIGLGRIVLLN
jgi:hypothetical protein